MGKDLIIHWYPEVDSTNRLAWEQAASSSQQTVWAALNQTGGRGQRGNTWTSDAGKNLTFSWLFKPVNLSPSRQFLISQVAALGICDYLSRWNLPSRIKWPNDIYVEDRKICGILIEHSLTSERILHSIVGIGLNLNQTGFPDFLPNPTSVQMERQRLCPGGEIQPLDLQEELLHLMTCLLHRASLLEDEDTGRPSLERDYLGRMYRLGETASYLDKTTVVHRRFTGTILGIDKRSCLRVLDQELGQERTFAFQEIAYCL